MTEAQTMLDLADELNNLTMDSRKIFDDVCGRAADALRSASTADTGDENDFRRSQSKQVFDFLTSIEGAGYGGMAVFEIARETMRRMCEDQGTALQAMAGVCLSHYKPVGYISRDGLTALRSDNDATICCDNSARGFDVPVYLAGEPPSAISQANQSPDNRTPRKT